MRRLLAVRDARIYLTGQVFSLFGDTALWLAMGIWVKTLTGSNAAAGLVFFFANVPVLLTPLTGLLVDRVRRRPLLIAVNALTGGAVLLLLLVHGQGQVWLIYLVMTWYGLSYSVLAAAQSALLTTMLPADLLADANGALRTVQESLRLAGPLAGAGLFVLGGAHTVVILDAATFAVPVISLLALRVAEPAPQRRPSHRRDGAERRPPARDPDCGPAPPGHRRGLRPDRVRLQRDRHLRRRRQRAAPATRLRRRADRDPGGRGRDRRAHRGATDPADRRGAAGRAGHAPRGRRGAAGAAAAAAVGGGRCRPVRGQPSPGWSSASPPCCSG